MKLSGRKKIIRLWNLLSEASQSTMIKCKSILFLPLIFSCTNSTHTENSAKVREHTVTIPTLSGIIAEVNQRKSLFIKMAPTLRRDSTNNYLVDLIGNKIYNVWKGTPWSFNGTTQTPGEGSIACGYFVTTVLNNIGFPIHRVRYAICPSLEMIRKATGNSGIENYSGKTIEEMKDKFLSRGKSVYVAGLDFHTGFVVCDGKEVYFLHSNFIRHEGVVKEPLTKSVSFRSSKTHWFGNISSNKNFQNIWFNN